MKAKMVPKFKGWDFLELLPVLQDLLRGYIPKRKKKGKIKEFFGDLLDLKHIFGVLLSASAIENTDWGEKEICIPKEKRRLAERYTRLFLKALIKSNRKINKHYNPVLKGLLNTKDRYIFWSYAYNLAGYFWN